MATAIQERPASLRSNKTILTSVTASVGALAFALGAPLAAQAATIEVTEEHADIVYIAATEQVGSYFDQDNIGFVGWPSADDYPIVFDNAAWTTADPLGTGSLFDSGSYVIPNDHDIEDYLPFVGLNYPATGGTNDFEVTLSLTPGESSNGDVRFIDESDDVVLDTDDVNAIYTLSPNTHEHFEIQLDGMGSGTEEYYLTFTVENTLTSDVETLETVFIVEN